MSKEIKRLQSQNEKQLIETYEKRLNNIKKQIVKAVREGQDTRLLKKIKTKIENEIEALQNDFQTVTNEIILGSYIFGVRAQKNQLKALYATPIVVFNVNNQSIKIYQKLVNNSFEIVSENIGQSVRAFLKTDFENPKAVLRSVKKLWNLNIPLVRVRNKQQKLLAARIEQDLKKVDLFKIPYHDKAGNVVRRVGVKSYSKMLARTITANTYRDGIKDLVLKQFEHIGDLVEVDGPEIFYCNACAEYYGQILSLTGMTKGYTTVVDAKKDGLFHPNCTHSYNVTKKIIDIYSNQ